MQNESYFKMFSVVRGLAMEFEPRLEFRPSLWRLLPCTDLQRASDVTSTEADIMSVFLNLFSKQSYLFTK